MTTKHLKQKPIISFIDDDGRKSVSTLLKPIFEEKTTKFNVCAFVENMKAGDAVNYLTPAELLEIQTAGNEVLSHGWLRDRTITSLDKTLWERELRESKQYLQSLGLNVNSYVWQGGAYNQESLEMAAQYYHSAWAIDQPYGIN